MDTFNFLWPSSAPANPNLNNQFHHTDTPSSNNLPPSHFFIPQAVTKLMDCQGFGDQQAASLLNMPCDLQDLLHRLNANSSASALATQTRMFEAKHSADLMGPESVLPSCSNTNLFQSSALSTSTSSLLSENIHDHESKPDRTVLPQSASFPTVPAHFEEPQQFSSNSSPNSSSLASTFPAMFPIMSTADNFLHAALNTLISANESDSDAGSSGDSCRFLTVNRGSSTSSFMHAISCGQLSDTKPV